MDADGAAKNCICDTKNGTWSVSDLYSIRSMHFRIALRIVSRLHNLSIRAISKLCRAFRDHKNAFQFRNCVRLLHNLETAQEHLRVASDGALKLVSRLPDFSVATQRTLKAGNPWNEAECTNIYGLLLFNKCKTILHRCAAQVRRTVELLISKLASICLEPYQLLPKSSFGLWNWITKTHTRRPSCFDIWPYTTSSTHAQITPTLQKWKLQEVMNFCMHVRANSMATLILTMLSLERSSEFEVPTCQ